MKCVKLTSSQRIVRCEEEYADILVKNGMGVLIGKEKWKADGKNYLEDKDKYILNKMRNGLTKKGEIE